MNSIQLLEKNFNDRVPSVHTQIDAPDKPEGLWFLDLNLDGHSVVVTWCCQSEFGVISSEIPEYGVWFHETYETLDDTFKRASDLLKTRTFTHSKSHEAAFLNKSPVNKKRLSEVKNRTTDVSLEQSRAKLGT